MKQKIAFKLNHTSVDFMPASLNTELSGLKRNKLHDTINVQSKFKQTTKSGVSGFGSKDMYD
jgi:hypothetical protein